MREKDASAYEAVLERDGLRVSRSPRGAGDEIRPTGAKGAPPRQPAVPLRG